MTSLSVDEPPSALLQQPNFSLEQAFQLVCLDESCTEVNLVLARIDAYKDTRFKFIIEETGDFRFMTN